MEETEEMEAMEESREEAMERREELMEWIESGEPADSRDVGGCGGMRAFTAWWLKHPWHVTRDAAVPRGCDCLECRQRRIKESADGRGGGE